MAAQTAVMKEGAAAFRELYDAMFRSNTPETGENPSVIFDQAAEQVCRGCLLVKRCWQAEYGETYNAFNDACGAMLKRGKAEAEDFPLFFTSRCLHFPELLDAVNRAKTTFFTDRYHWDEMVQRDMEKDVSWESLTTLRVVSRFIFRTFPIRLLTFGMFLKRKR